MSKSAVEQENMKPLVLFHSHCWDGFCAAWIARKALGDADFVPVQYGQTPPDVAGRNLYLLDFSYPRQVMRKILSSAMSVVILDHHQSAEQELAGITDEFIQRPDLIQNPPGSELPQIHFDMNKSGARLTWEYFALGTESPWLVDYTEDRDLWRHKLKDSEAINAALRSYPLDFKTWDSFADKEPQQFTVEGYAIRRREQQIIDDHVNKAVWIHIAGHRVLTVNATVLFSEIAGRLAHGHPFGSCYFDRNDGKRQWSLRSITDGTDVAQIAKAYGGGGHRNAAGFETLISQPTSL